MKKLLLLGGSAQQVVAIETAKRLGLYTVLCDYLSDNPGQYHADKFYLTSTTDKDAVLEIARRENVDGVLAYASDPAAPTAAYVAEKLGLPGSPTSGKHFSLIFGLLWVMIENASWEKEESQETILKEAL